MIKAFLPYLKKYNKHVAASFICVALEVLCELMQPVLMSQIVDIGIVNRDLAYITRTSLVMVLLALGGLVMGALGSYFSAISGQGFGAELRKAEFRKIQSFSFANMDAFSTPSLVTRLTSDITSIQNAFTIGQRLLVKSPLMLSLAMVLAVRINSKLAMVFFVAVPTMSVATLLILRKALPRFGLMQRAIDQMNRIVQENLIGTRVVKSFSRQDFEKEKFAAANTGLKDTAFSAIRLAILNGPVMQLVMYGSIVTLLWFGGNMVMAGSLLTGELISFISYVAQILISLMLLSMMLILLVRSRASGARVVEVLTTQVNLSDSGNAEMVPQDGSIEFSDVGFGYTEGEEQIVLRDIFLSVASGERIGIIGSTGSAKTTLVSLIPRLYDAVSGSIRVGGHDVRDYQLDTLRGSVAMVLQNNTLFSGSIRENLRWGNPHATNEEIEEACRAACAHDFIQSFPAGYETDLGQGGVNLSGGQKQRLCIARALLKKPKILILDDSTSAVDTATEASIRTALSQIPGTTVLIIAQRVASIQDADRIVVMNEGRIDAVGTHQELLQNNEIYRDVYTTQQEGAML